MDAFRFCRHLLENVGSLVIFILLLVYLSLILTANGISLLHANGSVVASETVNDASLHVLLREYLDFSALNMVHHVSFCVFDGLLIQVRELEKCTNFIRLQVNHSCFELCSILTNVEKHVVQTTHLNNFGHVKVALL